MRTESTNGIPHYCVSLAGTASELRKEGSLWSGFASGMVVSFVSSAVGGVCGLPQLKVPEAWAKAAMIAAGGLSGGVSASMAGGEFWDGVCNGLICAGLNHALHWVADGGWIILKGLEKLSLTTQGDAWKPSPTMCKYEILAKIEKGFLGEFARTAVELQEIARENGWDRNNVLYLYSKLSAEYYVYDAEYSELVDAMTSGDPVAISSVKLDAEGYAVANSGHARIIVGVLPGDDTELQLIDPLSTDYKYTKTSSLNYETKIHNIYYELIRFSKQTQIKIW